ncbi:MAG: helix-turn-helix domain-containing protein [Acidimicrobiales bacterium]
MTMAATELDLRIGDVAGRFGVSTRTLRYYEELGLLGPSGRTTGGERRYRAEDLVRLERIIECKDLLGMNLEEIRGFVVSQARLDELRVAYRAEKDTPTKAAKAKRRDILEEALALQTSLIERVEAKLTRMAKFRSEMYADAQRCRKLLGELA